MHPSSLRRCAVATLAGLLASSASADVLTVGAAGDFPQIQAAVDAAADLDVILVDSGDYELVTVIDKALTIVADSGATVTINGGLTVRDLAATRAVSLVGLTVSMEPGPGLDMDRPAVWLIQDAGSVRIEQCVLMRSQTVGPFGGSIMAEVVRAVGCADVAIARSALLGGTDIHWPSTSFPESPPAALSIAGSTVVVHGGSVTGSKGANDCAIKIDGGPGVALESGSLFLSGTVVLGGEGADGSAFCEFVCGAPGGDGGAGVALAGPSAHLRRQDAEINGGPGGPGGVGSPELFCIDTSSGQQGPALDVQAGLDATVSGLAHGFEVPSPAREGEPIAMTFSGEPGELVGAFWGIGTDSFWKASLHGQVLLDFSLPTFLLLPGALPASGELVIPFAFDDLGPGWEGITIHFQSIFGGGSSGVQMSQPVASVILDAAL